jgi:hypothetical protein
MVTRRQPRAGAGDVTGPLAPGGEPLAGETGAFETQPLPADLGRSDPADDDTVILDTVVDIVMVEGDRADVDETAVLEEALLETADARPIEYTPTQLINDPLLAADDEIVADLGLKLRWAAFLYGLVGVALAWTVAAQLTIGLGSGLGAYAWAAGATIVILAVGIWYFAHVADAYRDADSYRASRSAYTLRRLDRGRVILLTEELGRWIAFALGGFLLVVGVVTGLLFLVNPQSGARLIPLATIPVVVAYVFGFVALTYRLVDRARDAVA